jgi:hypothetical protein
MSHNKVYRRQLDIIKPTELLFPITIIGAGGTGSWTAFALAKMGAYSLTVIDYDRVEEHNTPSQLYAVEDVGRDKVSALQEILLKFTGKPIIPFSGKAQEYAGAGLPFGKVVICAVDSLEERKKLWEIIKPLLGGIDLYIDARMGGDQLRLLCVSPYNADSILKYQKKMESTAPADPTPCTARSVIYNTFLIGGMVASIVKRYAKKEDVEFDYMFDIANLSRV